MGTTVSYGGNTMRYDMDKDRVDIVKVNNLPENITATAMWQRMKMHDIKVRGGKFRGRPMDKFMMTYVISPSKEESAGWTLDDWRRLGHECINTLDSIDLSAKTKRKSSCKTNMKNSQYVLSLHHDSKSGTLHLHLACNRIDMDGNTNDDHMIYERALRAAEIINERRGWEQPLEIRDRYNQEIVKDANEILSQMSSFSFDKYFNELRWRGYEVTSKTDSHGKVVNYSVTKNSSYFTASELGKGKHLTAAHLKATWMMLHPQPSVSQIKLTPKEEIPGVKPISTQKQESSSITKVTMSKISKFSIKTPKGDFTCTVPDDIADSFKNDAVVPDGNWTATKQDVIDTAMLLFCAYVDAATSMSVSCGGGGSSPSSGWGKKDDEDEWMFAHRCLLMSQTMHKPRQRSRHR